jgi:hypothetical protein
LSWKEQFKTRIIEIFKNNECATLSHGFAQSCLQ